MPIAPGSRPAARAASSTTASRGVERGAGCQHREPAVAETPGAPERRFGGGTEPDRDRALHRERRDPRPGHVLVRARERHGTLGEQAAQQLDLLAAPAPAAREVGAQRFVLHRVPAEPDAQAEPAVGEEVDGGRLLGDERGLALRQDDDAGDELQRRDRREVAEQHERLVKRGVDVVGAGPRRVDLGIRAEHVVVGQQVREAELLDPLRVGADGSPVGADLGLGKDDTDLHGLRSSHSRFSAPGDSDKIGA